MSLLLSYALLDYAVEQSVVFRPYPTEEAVFEPICRAYTKMMGGGVPLRIVSAINTSFSDSC